MDQVYIDALVQQALGAYKAGGDEGLKRWKQALPVPHLKEFEKYCAEPLREAIKALGPVVLPLDKDATLRHAQDATQPTDPRKRHRRDRRRSQPL